MDTRIEGYAFLTGAFVLAGSSVVAGKVLAGLPVFFAAAGGAAIALIALVPLASREAKPARGALRSSLPLLAAQAFFGVALFRVLMLAALARSSASEAGIATSVTPVITALLSTLFLKEKIRWRVAVGIAPRRPGSPPRGLCRRRLSSGILALRKSVEPPHDTSKRQAADTKQTSKACRPAGRTQARVARREPG